jgi:mono/diheme cytochrome c family protein
MINTRIYVWPAAGVAVLTIGFTVFRFAFPAEPEINPDDAAQVAMGRAIYAEHCAKCHGANLEGQPNWKDRNPDGRLPAPPHDVTGHTWHHPDQQLMLITKKGLSAVVPGYQSDMPAFETVLRDEEIAAVLAFIESHWPEDIRERQRAMTRAASNGG